MYEANANYTHFGRRRPDKFRNSLADNMKKNMLLMFIQLQIHTVPTFTSLLWRWSGPLLLLDLLVELCTAGYAVDGNSLRRLS